MSPEMFRLLSYMWFTGWRRLHADDRLAETWRAYGGKL